MNIDANYIRKFASDAYIKPAKSRGESKIVIPVGRVEANLRKVGLESGRTPAVCSALSGKKFLRENEIVLDHWDGPPSRQSTTVVFHYRFAKPGAEKVIVQQSEMHESPAEKAFRLTEKLRGLLKDEMAEYGGGDAFIRWVRSEDEDVR